MPGRAILRHNVAVPAGRSGRQIEIIAGQPSSNKPTAAAIRPKRHASGFAGGSVLDSQPCVPPLLPRIVPEDSLGVKLGFSEGLWRCPVTLAYEMSTAIKEMSSQAIDGMPATPCGVFPIVEAGRF